MFTRKAVRITWIWHSMEPMFCLKVPKYTEHTKSMAKRLHSLLLADPRQKQSSKMTRLSTNRVTAGFVRTHRPSPGRLKNSPNRSPERTSHKPFQRQIPCWHWSPKHWVDIF